MFQEFFSFQSETFYPKNLADIPEESEPQRVEVVLEDSHQSRMAKKGFLNRYRKQSGFQVSGVAEPSFYGRYLGHLSRPFVILKEIYNFH